MRMRSTKSCHTAFTNACGTERTAVAPSPIMMTRRYPSLSETAPTVIEAIAPAMPDPVKITPVTVAV